MTAFLGISGFSHDSAAALVVDGRIVAAAQEERFTRRRHDPAFPQHAVRYCLDRGGLGLDELEAVVFHEDPALRFDRIRANFSWAGARGYGAFVGAMREWRSWKLDTLGRIRRELGRMYPGQDVELRHTTHHRSHAASAFLPSPYERAAVLTIDGVGEWESTTLWRGEGRRLEQLSAIEYPHSLGLLYSAFTQYCGFKVDSGEYKLMGLAPYGRACHVGTIRHRLVDLKPDGSYELNAPLFEFVRGKSMIGPRFERVFGRPSRAADEPIEQFHCDIAASIQQVTEDAVLGLAREARRATGMDRLVLAGGVALNCVASGVVDRAGVFDELWVQPAAGDAGCALGAALDAAVNASGRRVSGGRGEDAMQGSLLGPDYERGEILRCLDRLGARYELVDDDRFAAAATRLAAGDVVGWFQGRMEFGPRALGARSILADARDPSMQTRMNRKIKFRESFRPFAPAVLAEDAEHYFDVRSPSPHMLLASPVRPALRTAGRGGLGTIGAARSTVPAVTHVDHSARVQTVRREDNADFHELLSRFRALTGSSVLVNTSFNVRGEPIVMDPEQAYTCFMRTGMDALVLGPCLLRKDDQPPFVDSPSWRDDLAED